MAYLPDLHYCGICGKYLGPDDGDGLCGTCELDFCENCGEHEEGLSFDGGTICSKCKQLNEDDLVEMRTT